MDSLSPPAATADQIVKRAGSNLAFALALLDRDRRADMRVFYAFCRVVDDLADEPAIPIEERREGLQRWRDLIGGLQKPVTYGLEPEFVNLCQRRALKQEDLIDLIDGVEMDLTPREISTEEELRDYCYHVASAVGLVSIEIFGYEKPETRHYAEQLGYALQWTNILRDVGEDAEEGRVFIPTEILHRHGLSREDILSGKPREDGFLAVATELAAQARDFYTKAEAALPDADRSRMRSAELMKRIYSGILDKMEGDAFRVFQTRYRLSKGRMIAEFLRAKLFD